ncbi:hypothetical protein B0H19DRAFT_81932 [Mycena capillaripes]|nr:hypothetical protein B0H19DRAFT_81932 [Mycena capillaripes]
MGWGLSRRRPAPVCRAGGSRGWEWGGWNWMARARVSVRPHVRACASAAGKTRAVTRTRHISGREKVYSQPVCRPSRVCASVVWDDTRAMAILVHGTGRARAKTSAALVRCRCTSRRGRGIVEVGEEGSPVEARGSVRQDERGAGMRKGRRASGRCRTTSEWRYGRIREGSKMKREGTTQRRCDDTGYIVRRVARAIRAVRLSTGLRP